MRKSIFGMTLAAILAVGVLPAAADHHEGPDPDKKLNVSGEIRTRWEYSDNVFDADSDIDDGGDFMPYRARVGVDGSFTDDVSGMVEMQAFGYFGEFDPQVSLQHAVGQSGVVFGGGNYTGLKDEVSLYQAYLHLANLGDSDWALRIGRQEYTLGNELHFGDADFYDGISLDGIRAMRDGDSWDLDLFYFLADEQGLNFGLDLDNQNEIWGATLDFHLADGDQSLTPYLFFNRDTGSGFDRDRVYTLGAQWASTDDFESAWDWSAEIAIQSGDTNQGPAEQDVSASIFEGTLGFTTNDVHRFHVGYLTASGDDGVDPDAEGFRPILPDQHANNRLGDLDLFGGPTVTGTGGLTNVTDISVGYTWMGDGNRFRASLHNLALTEEGPGVGAEDDIGNEIDLVYDWDYSRNAGFQVGYAHLLAGDLLNISPTIDGDDVMRAWAQFRLRWK